MSAFNVSVATCPLLLLNNVLFTAKKHANVSVYIQGGFYIQGGAKNRDNHQLTENNAVTGMKYAGISKDNCHKFTAKNPKLHYFYPCDAMLAWVYATAFPSACVCHMHFVSNRLNISSNSLTTEGHCLTPTASPLTMPNRRGVRKPGNF